MLRALVVVLAVLVGPSGSAHAFFGGALTGSGGEAKGLPGIRAAAPLFDPAAGLSPWPDGTVLVELDSRRGVRARGNLHPMMRNGSGPELGYFALRLADGSYRFEPSGPAGAGELGRFFGRAGMPFGVRAFSLHRLGGLPGGFVVQLPPVREGGEWNYFPLRWDGGAEIVLAPAIVFREVNEIAADLRASGHSVQAEGGVFEAASAADLQALIDRLEGVWPPLFAEGPPGLGAQRAAFGLAAPGSAALAEFEAEMWSRACVWLAAHPLDPGLPSAWQGVPQAALDLGLAAPACARAREAGLRGDMARMAAARVALLAARRVPDRAAWEIAAAEYRAETEAGTPLAPAQLALLVLGFESWFDPDPAAAEAILRAAHAEGNHIAGYMYGALVMGGHLPADAALPVDDLLRAAAESGIAEAHWRLGLLHADAGDPATAATHYRRGAGRNDPNSLQALAYLLYNGQGVPQDLVEARDVFRRAAAHGLGDSSYMFGFMNFYGQGGAQSFPTAATHLARAERRGLVAARAELGAIRALGLDGRRPEVVEGVALLNEAAAAGVASAPRLLDTVRHELGLGTGPGTQP